jgi:hypothetical protein
MVGGSGAYDRLTLVVLWRACLNGEVESCLYEQLASTALICFLAAVEVPCLGPVRAGYPVELADWIFKSKALAVDEESTLVIGKPPSPQNRRVTHAGPPLTWTSPANPILVSLLDCRLS